MTTKIRGGAEYTIPGFALGTVQKAAEDIQKALALVSMLPNNIPSKPSGDDRTVSSVFHGSLTVDIVSEEQFIIKPIDEKINLKTRSPSIIVHTKDNIQLLLTWDEVRELVAALTEVTDIAEFG